MMLSWTERKKCCLPWREMCCLLNKEREQRTGSDMLLQEEKNVNNLHFGSSHSQKTFQNPSAGRSQCHLGVFLSKKQTLWNKDFPWLKVLLRYTQIRQGGEETLTQINIVLAHWNQHKHQSRCSSTAVFPGTVCSLAEELLNKNPPCHQLGRGGGGRFSVAH